MAFDWTSYLTLAKTLASAAADEAALRSAVSRSYYCVFNLAMARAERNDYQVRADATGGSHEHLWDLYSRQDKSDACANLARLGPRLKRRRIMADYRQSFPKLAEEALEAIAEAEKCIALLGTLPRDLPVNKPRTWAF